MMPIQNKRTTVYLNPKLHKALRLKALDSNRSVSEIINQTLWVQLAEDAEDLAAFEEAENEPDISYEEMMKRLKKDGLI
jgi:hypothetical protein